MKSAALTQALEGNISFFLVTFTNKNANRTHSETILKTGCTGEGLMPAATLVIPQRSVQKYNSRQTFSKYLDSWEILI